MTKSSNVICSFCGQELPLRQSIRTYLKGDTKWVYAHGSCFWSAEDKRIKKFLSEQDGEGETLDSSP